MQRARGLGQNDRMSRTIAALIGLAIAAAGVCASAFLNLLWAEGLASCAIGVLLIADAVVILLATRSLIAGESVALPLQKDMSKPCPASQRFLDSYFNILIAAFVIYLQI